VGPVAAVARSQRVPASRGFTLMELMIVVVLVAILASLAIPTMASTRRDRVTANAATRASLLIRSARGRAIERGAAHMVHLATDGTANRGTFSDWEAVSTNIVNGAASGQNRNPLSTCRGAHWGTDLTSVLTPSAGVNGMIRVDGFVVGGPQEVELDLRSFINSNGGTATCICFSPSGRAYVDTCGQPAGANFAPATSPTFAAMTTLTAIQLSFQRGPLASPIGLRRHVLIPPTGATRVTAGP
jgi:prepilin-type N-terminal cleavage/methylation domain-containing protein